MITLLDDKFTFRNFGFKEIDGSDKPITPEYDHKTVKIPQRNGYWDFGTEINALNFSIPLMIPMQSKQTKENRFSRLIAFLTDEYNRPRLIKFVFDYEPDKYIYAKLSQQVDLSRVKVGQIVVLNFIAIDPIKYAKSDEYDPKKSPIYGEVVSGDRYQNTQSFNWSYPKHYSGIHNYSSFVTVLKITIKGTLKNASITHIQSKIKLTLPDIKNQTLIVDSKRFNVTVNGRDSFNSNLDFFEIFPGDNGFLFESELPNAAVKFEWLHQF